MKTSIFISILTIGITFAACSGKTKEGSSREVAKVTVNEVKETRAPIKHTYSGLVQSKTQSTLSTKLMGQINQVTVDKGDVVRKGDLLVSIRSQALNSKKQQVEASIREAEAAYTNTKINYKRIKRLHEQESVTQKEFDDISSRLKMAEARLNAAQERLGEINEMLQYASIRAPYDGVIVSKFVNSGEMASPGTPLLAMEAPGDYEILTRIPESDMNLWQTGDTAKVHIKSADLKVKGEINKISPSSKFSGPQYEILIGLPKDETGLDQLKSGMFASVTMSKGNKKIVEVPRELVFEKGQLTGIWMVSSGKQAVKRWIRTGEQNNDKVEVLSGLQPGEQYIVEHDIRLFDGIALEINK